MRADAEGNRREIIEAAWRLFSEQGPEASLRSVAAEAGVGIATLYRHFPSREDLLLGLVELVHERVAAVTDARLAGWDADPAGSWRGFVGDFAALRLGTLIARMAPVASGISDFGTRTGELRAATLSSIERILDAARHEGLVSEDLDAPRFFAALAVISRPLPTPAAELLPDEMTWLVDVFVRGAKGE